MDCQLSELDSAEEDRLLADDPVDTATPALAIEKSIETSSDAPRESAAKRKKNRNSPLHQLRRHQKADEREAKLKRKAAKKEAKRKAKASVGQQQLKKATEVEKDSKSQVNAEQTQTIGPIQAKQHVAKPAVVKPTRVIITVANRQSWNNDESILTEEYIKSLTNIPKSRRHRLRQKLKRQQQDRLVHARNEALIDQLEAKYGSRHAG